MSRSASMWELLEAVEDTAKELNAHEGEDDEHGHEHHFRRKRLDMSDNALPKALPHVRMRRSTRSTRNIRMIRKKDTG